MKRLSVEKLTIEMRTDIQGFTISKKYQAIQSLMVLILPHFSEIFIIEKFYLKNMILGIIKVETQGTLLVKSII